jgi:carbonic anhydrase
VPVELLFDQGIGDIFVIRVAGNVCGEHQIGSIEYGVDHLETPVVVVLGHTHCGAVTAAVTEAELHGSIPKLVEHVRPAVAKARSDNPDLLGEELVAAAIEANVWQCIKDLLKLSPAVCHRVKDGKLKVVGAIYDIEGGSVNWIGIHPEQDRLLTQA